MSTTLAGTYEFWISLGVGAKQHLNIDVNMLEELTITQDINKTLPTLRMRISDPTGALSYLATMDSTTNTIFVKIKSSTDTKEENVNEFVFKIYRKTPVQVSGGAAMYDIVGALAVNKFFSPSYVRSNYDPTIKSLLSVRQFMGRIIEEMVADTDIYLSAEGLSNSFSTSVDYTVPVYQPNWTNAELFEDLKKRLRGKDGESGYKIFLSMKRSQLVLNVKTWNELCSQPVAKLFIVGDNPVDDVAPIISHRNYDNYMLMGATGIKKQNYQYYDYEKSMFVESSVSINDLSSLTRYHLIDSADSEDSDSAFYGRTHEFTEDFSERATSTLCDKATNLVKMWADTDGGDMHNLQPGSIVQVLFGLNMGGHAEDYQHSGFWMVEKVLHLVGKTFITRMLLTRTGLDGYSQNTLMKASNVRRTTIGAKK